MREHIANFLKGLGMGAANVVPGVSGGTIALITNIFERLIDALKSIDATAVRLLLGGKFKELARHVDLVFLVCVFGGIGVSIISLAIILEFLMAHYPVLVWAYFFGLILASVYFVARTVGRWDWRVATLFAAGCAAAVAFTVLTPASENNSFGYNMICGAVAACAMILPGLSGSFVLLLMGNYQLVMIEAVAGLDFGVLIPVGVGAVVGILAFSRVLSWIFKRFRDQTLGLLSGFVLGSLAIIWPWKVVTAEIAGKTLTQNVMPAAYAQATGADPQVGLSVVMLALGVATIVALELAAARGKKGDAAKA